MVKGIIAILITCITGIDSSYSGKNIVDIIGNTIIPRIAKNTDMITSHFFKPELAFPLASCGRIY